MPGKLFSHFFFVCLGAVVLVGLVSPGTVGAQTTHGAPRLVDLADGSVPSWCHQNLQLISEPTRWLGYRDINLLKRRFSPLGTSPVYYRAFVSDRNVYVFSAEANLPASDFGVEDGFYTPTAGRPGASSVSFYLRASAYEVLVWCAMPDASLLAVRVNDPAAPIRHGTVALDRTPMDLFVQYRGNRYTIFTANGPDGLRVYQLPAFNWISAERRGSIDTPGDAMALAHQDSLLFVADGIEGIQVVDVTDVDSLVHLAHYRTLGPAKQVAVRDTLLFVAEWEAGVEILNIASLDSIFPLASIDTPGRAHGVAAQDSLLFVADWDGGLRVYNFARMDSIYLYGFYGIGSQYHSVAASDSIVVAGDHTGLQILRLGNDRQAPAVTATVTQTPYFRSYLRTYVMASECLDGVPEAKQLLLPRQAVVEDFEGYADSDTLRLRWTAVDVADTVSLAETAFEGSQAMEFDVTIPKNKTRLVRRDFDTPQDWRLFDRMAFHYKAGGDTLVGKLRAKVFTSKGDSLMGGLVAVGSGWREYMLDLSDLAPEARGEIHRVQLGVSSVRTDSTMVGSLLVDHLLLKRVEVGEATKDARAAFLGDTLDVDLSVVAEERNLYIGDFQMVPSDTGMTNAILITATDYSGNVSATLKEFRAQLVVPGEGGVLRSPDSRLSLAVPPDATREEAFFFILPQEPENLPSLPEAAGLVGRPYEVGLSEDNLLRDVDFVFRLDGVSLAGIDREELGVYRQDGNGWQYLGGRYDPAENTVRVSGSNVGLVALLADPNRPVPGGADPAAFRCYPNPFNPNATISFACPARTHVTLCLYDVGGRLVKTLVDDVRSAGSHFVTWDGRGDDRTPGATGVYFARLEIGGETQTIKLVLIR